MNAELHFITALISKNTWFADYHSKAVFHRKHQDIAETSIIQQAPLQLSFNLLRGDL